MQNIESKKCPALQFDKYKFWCTQKCVFKYIRKIENYCLLIYNKIAFSLFWVLPVNCREVYILKFILTFRLAMDARLHQKTELRAENQP